MNTVKTKREDKPLKTLPMSVLWLSGSLLTGCVATEEYTLYLQDVHVSGPISQPPVHTTNNKSGKPVSITPHVAFNGSGRAIAGRIDGHSPVGGDGTFQ